jgi:putative endonuclease
MTPHAELGRQGEELAVEYLQKNGHEILHRNWRYSRYEIDIITLKKGIPHFIEVKTRSTSAFGKPEESVNGKKLRDLLKAVDEFMFHHKNFNNFRVDILSINIREGAAPNFFLVEDVYL